MTEKKQAMMLMLKKLADDFHRQVPERIDKIQQAWVDYNTGFDMEKHAHLLRLSHNLAGTSGTFGFSSLSKAAKTLELSLEGIDNAENLQKNIAIISSHIEKLTQV